MRFIARPVERLGALGTPAAVAAILLGAALLWTAALSWDGISSSMDATLRCARAAPAQACAWPGGLASLILGALLGPALAALGAALLATGTACAVRPVGGLDPHGQRLLDDATRHRAAGGLSVEGYQATTERLHAQAARRSVPQVALALSLLGASLAVLTFLLVGGVLAQVGGLRGLGAAPAGPRAVLGVTGACAAAALAAAFLVLAQASRWRARARAEASALQQMLTDLESDILDEVRRSAPHPEPEAAPDPGAAPSL
ncbi:MAG TPA: hypothetical protein VM241_00095 [Candidatus Thermoplasmatota archaeon]|nr:hypothetical protein [Candidatus Thermoplasmatota archaeon]